MQMMMLETRRGCEHYRAVKRFVEGEEYDIANGLAHAFYLSGFAIPVNFAKNIKKAPSCLSVEK